MLSCIGNSHRRILCFLRRKYIGFVRVFPSRKPISTYASTISLWIRRHYATSRVRAIIRSHVPGRRTELTVILVGAFAVLGLWGTGAEGQTSLIDRWVSHYVEETALVMNVPMQNSVLQMADMSTVVAGSGGDGSTISPTPSMEASTIRESALAAVTPPDEAYLTWLSSQRSQITTYEVQEGDLISFIASDFGVSADSIVWANGLRSADSIYPGQILKIPPVSGVIHTVKAGDTVSTIAKKYAVEADQIVAYNKLPQDGALQVGEELIVPGGRPAAATTTSVAAIQSTTARFSHLPDLGTYFQAPTYGYNWGRIHGRNGIDVANSCGTPVVAAADGTITVADDIGYNGGFGKYIKISHANGTETLYAHSSKLLVTAGQVVGKGQKIMLMGTTGRSTGCHLHFEVHGAKNPLAK